MLVLDTNVASELMRPEPASEVADWISERDATEMFLTAVSEAGAALRYRDHTGREAPGHAGGRHDPVVRPRAFPNGSCPLTAPPPAPMRRSLQKSASRAGRSAKPTARLPAISRSRGAVLVTRNVRDFEGTGVNVVNPWSVAQA